MNRMYLLASSIALTLAVIFLAALPAQAQERSPFDPLRPSPEVRERFEALRDGVLQRHETRVEALDQARQLRDRTQEVRDRTLDEMHDRLPNASDIRDRLRNAATSTRAEFRMRGEEVRERLRAAAATSTRAEFRAHVQDRVEELRQKRDEIVHRMRERASERAERATERILERLGRALEHFAELLTRVESRLEKFAERGVDTSEADEAVENARLAIADAEAATLDAQASIEALVLADDPRAFFADMREIVREAVEEIRAAHRATVDAVRSMSLIADELEQHNRPDNTATSTAATSTVQADEEDEGEDEQEDESDED